MTKVRVATVVAVMFACIPHGDPQAFSTTDAASGSSHSTKQRVTAVNDKVRPFQIHVSDAMLAGLRRRVAARKWPDRETVTDRSQGVHLVRAAFQSLR